MLGVSYSPNLQAQDTAALTARMQHAAQVNTLTDPSLKPWHMTLAVQTMTPRGVPEAGTVEMFWAGPGLSKTVYTFPDLKVTLLQNDAGSFHTKGAGYPPDSLDLLIDQVLHPVPADALSKDAAPTMTKQEFGKLALDCVVLPRAGAAATLGASPTYCLDPATDVVRVAFNYGNLSMTRNGVGHFQGRSVATDIGIKLGATPIASVKITALDAKPVEAATYAATPELERTGEHMVRVAGSVMADRAINKVQPLYPFDAKQRRIQGTVVLHAVIGADGKVKSVTPISSPNEDMTRSAAIAAKQWMYKPYLVDDKAVDVETTITFAFTLS